MSSGDVFDGAVSIRRSTSDGVTGAKDDRIGGKALCGQFVIVPLNAHSPVSTLAFTCFTLSTKNVEIPFARTEVSRPSNHGISDLVCNRRLTVFQSNYGLSATLVTSSQMCEALDAVMTLCARRQVRRYARLSSTDFVRENLLSSRRRCCLAATASEDNKLLFFSLPSFMRTQWGVTIQRGAEIIIQLLHCIV